MNTFFFFDVRASTGQDVVITSLSVLFKLRNAQFNHSAFTIGFKPESILPAPSFSGWNPVSVSFAGRRQGLYTWNFRQLLPAGTVGSFRIFSGPTTQRLRYNGNPFLDGDLMADGALVTDGTLTLERGAGASASQVLSAAVRFFSGALGYCRVPAAVVPPMPPPRPPSPPEASPPPSLPPAASPPPPPPPASVPPPSASASATVRSEADILAALSAWPVGTILTLTVASNVTLSREIAVPAGRALVVKGDSAACTAGLNASDAYEDYDYSSYTVPSLTPLPLLCAFKTALASRHFSVPAGASLTLESLLLLNGRVTAGSGGSVSAAAGAALRVQGCVFAGNYAKQAGGAISVGASAAADALVVLSSTFRDNFGGSGGDIASAAPTAISDCTFNNSFALFGSHIHQSGCA